MLKILKYIFVSILLLLGINFGLSKGNEYLIRKILNNMKEIEVRDISLKLTSPFWNTAYDIKGFKIPNLYDNELKDVKISHNIFKKNFVLEFEMNQPAFNVLPNIWVSITNSKCSLIVKYYGNIFSKEIEILPDMECDISELSLLNHKTGNYKELEEIFHIKDINFLMNIDIKSGEVQDIKKMSFDGYPNIPFLKGKTIKFNYDLLKEEIKAFASIPHVSASLRLTSNKMLSRSFEIFNSLSHILFKISIDELPRDELLNFNDFFLNIFTKSNPKLYSEWFKKFARFSSKIGVDEYLTGILEASYNKEEDKLLYKLESKENDIFLLTVSNVTKGPEMKLDMSYRIESLPIKEIRKNIKKYIKLETDLKFKKFLVFWEDNLDTLYETKKISINADMNFNFVACRGSGELIFNNQPIGIKCQGDKLVISFSNDLLFYILNSNEKINKLVIDGYCKSDDAIEDICALYSMSSVQETEAFVDTYTDKEQNGINIVFSYPDFRILSGKKEKNEYALVDFIRGISGSALK